MPKVTVNRTSGPEVRPTPIPGARVTENAPIEAFGGGAGLNAQTEAARGALQNVQKIVVLEKAKADQIAFQDADLELSKLQNKIEIDTAKMQGKNAADAPDFASSEWGKGVEAIRKSLKNDEQRAKFEKSRSLREIMLNETVQKHTFSELDKYDTQSSESSIINARDEAFQHYNDTTRIEASIIKQEETYLGWAKRKGVDEETIKKGLRDIHTKTHSGIITNMLSDGQTAAAIEYYEANKDHLPPDDRKDIKKLIDEESLETNTQTWAAEIMQKAGPNLGDTEKYLNDISDKDTREKVKEKLEPMLRQAREQQNNQEADIASRVSQNTYTLADFKKDEAGMDRSFANAVQMARRPAQSKTYEESWDNTYLSLLKQYVEISGQDPEKQPVSYSTLRKEVLINKPKLREEHYKELINLTSPGYVIQNKEKSGWFSGIIKAIQEAFPKDGRKAARATDEFMEKAKTSSPDKLQESAKAIIDKENARDNTLAVRYKEAKTITTPKGTTLKVIGEAADGTPIIEEPK